MTENTTGVLPAASYCLERGWAPLPIPHGTKAPNLDGWRELRFDSPQQLAEHFDGCNIGLILGAASRGLVDVDLDCEEAVAIAPALLPHTGLRHGRASALESHYWYVTDREVATAKFQDPVVKAEKKRRKLAGEPTDDLPKEMLVELRSTGAQTVIPPSIHPSGEELVWSAGESGEPREMDAAALAMRVRVVAAAALLARYWPESGSRHDATLALAGGLLRSGWNEKNATYFVLAIATAADPSVDRSDRAAAVSSTAERLEQDRDTRGWRTLNEYVPKEAVSKAREWLDLTEDEADPDEDEFPDEIRGRVELGQLIEDGVPPPEWLIPGMFYREAIHWWHGEPGDGKTFMLLGLMYRLAEEGFKVLWIDEESGQNQTAFRLQGYDAQPEVLRERFIYHARPGLTLDPVDLHALFTEVAEVRPDVVIFDSVADMLGQAGLDEDSNVDVTRWVKSFLEPLKFEYGCSVIAIDHVTKSKDSRGKYARGAGAKKSKTDAAWKVVKFKDFGVGRIGGIRLESDKDRDGWLEPKLGFRIGGNGKGLTILEPIDAVQAGGNKLPEGELEQRLVEFLRLNADCETDAQVTRDVEAAVTGKNTSIRTALKALLADPETGVRAVDKGRAQLWWWEDLSASIELDFRGLDDD